jgi:hypothetical protein
MKRYRIFVRVFLCLLPIQLTFAQTSTPTASALPRLVRFGGTATELNGKPLTGVAGISLRSIPSKPAAPRCGWKRRT